MRNRLVRAVAACALSTLALLSLAGLAQNDTSLLRGDATPPDAVRLETLDLGKMTQGYGTPQIAKSITGGPILLKGVTYPHGVGSHAESEVLIDLKGSALRFLSMVGLDDARIGQGSITFQVFVDGKLAAETPVMHGGDEPRLLSVDLNGKKMLELIVGDGGDGIANDHADWAGAMILMKPGATDRPQTINLPVEAPPAIHSGDSPVPAIHGPRIVGTTPGRPFLFRIPATGTPPLAFTAKGLPRGLKLDPKTGFITGALAAAGTTDVALSVKGPRGVGRRPLRIVGGKDCLALTPPMGWNSWYVWFGDVSQQKMQDAADWMVRSGLAAHGFQYVCIDDCWQGKRDANGEITGNARFADMQALADHIHSLGLKFGTYSSPGPKTCAGYEGSYKHEQQDARTYARWGVDLLKHDWCSYGDIAKDASIAELQKPYRMMKDALESTNRDMVFSLCQYGMGKVWEWGRQVGGNFWRTTGDSGDTWGAVSAIGFAQSDFAKYAGPRGWNDPDMLMVGKLGGNSRQTRMTPNEQIAQVTLWSMIAAPLLLSCDMTRLDRFTVDLLTNDEVIDVDQDPIGSAGARRWKDGLQEVWSRKLYDRTTAVALFNRGPLKERITARWSDVEVTGRQQVRDLWLQKNLGAFAGSFSATVPAHGALLLKVGKPTGDRK